MQFRKILIAVNESEQADHALEAGAELARELSASVVLVHVVNRALAFPTEVGIGTEEILAQMRADGQALLDRSRARLPDGVPVERVLAEGKPSAEIVRIATTRAVDLIVLGTHGRGRLATFIVGSTAEAVIREAPCPVMAVRQTPHAAAAQQEQAAANATTNTTTAAHA